MRDSRLFCKAGKPSRFNAARSRESLRSEVYTGFQRLRIQGTLVDLPGLATRGPYTAVMRTMNVSLPDDLIEFVRDAVDGEGYGNNSDVVRDALRLLRAQRSQRAALQNLVAVGIAQIDAGEGVPLTTDVLKNIADRAKKRAARKRGTRN